MEQLSATPGLQLNQPWRGICGLAIVVAFALTFTSLFSAQVFNGLFTLLSVTVVPFLVMVGLGWKVQYPPTHGLIQPWKGLLLVGFCVLMGALVGFGVMNFLADGIPQPFINTYVIITVITTFFLVIAFGMWPYNKLSAGLAGWLTLITAFVLTWFIFKLFNFSLLSFPSGTDPSSIAPVAFYAKGGPLAAFAGLAPHGPIPWESALAGYFWAVVWLFVFANVGMWPFCKAPKLMGEPVLGIIVTVSSLALGVLVTYIAVSHLNIEPLTFLLVGVCWLFGVLVVMILFQMWPGRALPQPLWGMVNLALAACIGLAGYLGYRVFALWHFGGAADKYPIDIFTLAGMMLAVTFPAMAVFSDFFEFWPLPPTPAPPEQS
ncbi:MAG: hypothetical protein M0Z81_18430 [Deltaproteobacteria bacterium]|jgi:hypothetical protein|nr:hypothetical protein [Deltaproteobacteria bacterium]